MRGLAAAEKHHAELWAGRIRELGAPAPQYVGHPAGQADSLTNRVGGADLAGGATGIVSAQTVHNILLEERPDCLKRLYEPYYFDRRAELRPGESPTLRAARDELTTAEAYRLVAEHFGHGLPPLDAVENEDWGRDYVLQHFQMHTAEELAAVGLSWQEGEPPYAS